MNWNYYFSGILYGRFCTDGDALLYQWRDEATARFSEYAPLTSNESDALKKWANLDVLSQLSNLEAYRAAFASGSETVKGPGGSIYSRREPSLYVERYAVLPTDILLENGTPVAFICPSRESTAILVQEGMEERTIIKEWADKAGEPPVYPVQFLGAFDVMTRDGVRLSTDVYLPDGAGEKLPAILVRTCYNKRMLKHKYMRFVQWGYAVILQDVRGREASEGAFIPNYYEEEDGDDTLNWIAAQNWSDGKVGTIGGSYLGYVQWAAAASGNPHLSAIVSIVTSGSPFVDIPRRGGCFTSGMLAWAFAMSEREFHPELMARDDWDTLLDLRPISRIAEEGLGHGIPFLDEWLRHPDSDEFWQKCDWKARNKGRQVPALILSGWFDDDSMGTTQALELTHDYPAGSRKIVLGPWMHNANSRYDIHGLPMGTQALRYDLDLLYLLFFERHVRGIENGIDKTPAVEYFTLTENKWKYADNWPLPQSRELTLYLGGEASGADGLLLNAPGETGADTYAYDPANPATHIIDMSENEIGVPEDYTEEEKRADVLTYTTPVLERDVVVTGDALITLYISSTAVDTDFVARISEVDASGRSIKLADSMLCAKYRDSFETPALLTPGETYTLTLRSTKVSKLFRAGCRIRVSVTSSAKNFTFPHSNTAEGFNGLAPIVARNTVHYGQTYPSRVVLLVEQ